MTTAQILEHLRSLPVEDRAHVADALLRTLNEPDQSVDRAWIEEAERRLAALRSGEVAPIPAEDVFDKALGRFEQ